MKYNPLDWSGITLRDYFAAAALTGYCANPADRGAMPDKMANWAYEQADAMIEKRDNMTHKLPIVPQNPSPCVCKQLKAGIQELIKNLKDGGEFCLESSEEIRKSKAPDGYMVPKQVGKTMLHCARDLTKLLEGKDG